MADIYGKTRELYRLETLAEGNTILHRLHPGVKLAGCIGYLICLLSLPPAALGRMAAFVWYPIVLIALGELPLGMMLRRCLLVLPFCLFIGVGNLIVQRQVVLSLGTVPVTAGMISCLGIVLRAVLSVAAVLILIGTTPFSRLTGLLRRLHFPGMLIALLEMTYRYIGVLMEEAGSLSDAYHLRAPGKKGLEMRHMGPLAGSLLLRSFDRAERIYGAMECRGYGSRWSRGTAQKLTAGDLLFLLAAVGSSVLFRMVDVAGWLGGVLSYWM